MFFVKNGCVCGFGIARLKAHRRATRQIQTTSIGLVETTWKVAPIQKWPTFFGSVDESDKRVLWNSAAQSLNMSCFRGWNTMTHRHTGFEMPCLLPIKHQRFIRLDEVVVRTHLKSPERPGTRTPLGFVEWSRMKRWHKKDLRSEKGRFKNCSKGSNGLPESVGRQCWWPPAPATSVQHWARRHPGNVS